MANLKTKSKNRILDNEQSTPSKCISCEYYEDCSSQSDFDEDAFNGCMDYKKKQAKTSALEK